MRPTFLRLLLPALLLAAGPGQAAPAAPYARDVPTTYGKFDKHTGTLSLVVAELVATEHLKGYDCPDGLRTRTNPDGTTTVSLCLGAPPFWFKARVLKHVAGADVGDEFYAVSGSHWGAPKIGRTEPARLMLLNSNGSALEMVRYAVSPVVRSTDRQYHLVLQMGRVPWLPCWVTSLKQDIDYDKFVADLAITREEYDDRWAEEDAAYYRVTADSVRPRYAIPVTALEQAFRNVPLVAADFSCAPKP